LRPFFLLSALQREMRPVGRIANQKETTMSQIGTVKFFNSEKGFGFITPDAGGQDAFVHISAVERSGLRTLDANQRVKYELENDKRGRQSACNLEPAA
jgi:CspA family cold shock protein